MTKGERTSGKVATVAAKVLNGRPTGRIDKGPMFGFVVLGGDPLQDIGNLRKVRAVVLSEGGDVLARPR
mgnify:CR=1 FL=1